MNKIYNSEIDILLVGAGGHAKVIIETVRKFYPDYRIIGITDNNDEKKNQFLMNIPIIGNDNVLMEMYNNGIMKAFISLGTVKEYKPRENIYFNLKKIGFKCINIIHGSSIISDNIKLGEGNAILAGAIINVDVEIGNNCIINSGSIIEHECKIGNNVHIATGAKIAGQVIIEDNCMIGIGSNIKQCVHIGKNSIVGAGSVVLEDVPANTIVAGIPAKVIKRLGEI